MPKPQEVENWKSRQVRFVPNSDRWPFGAAPHLALNAFITRSSASEPFGSDGASCEYILKSANASRRPCLISHAMPRASRQERIPD